MNYRVMVKQGRKYVGTGENSQGIAIEYNVMNQSFYTKEDAEVLVKELQAAGFDAKTDTRIKF